MVKEEAFAENVRDPGVFFTLKSWRETLTGTSW
jgi:hypothetical protein